MSNPFDRQLGNFDDAYPEGGQPRAAMGELETTIPYRENLIPRGWRLGKAEYSEWTIYNGMIDTTHTYWQWLVQHIPDMIENVSNAPVAFRPTALFQYNAFRAAAGNFDAFINAIGRRPSSSNMPTTMYQGTPILPLPYPDGGGGALPRSIRFAFRWGIYCSVWVNPEHTISVPVTPSGMPFMVSIPTLTSVALL